MGAFYPNASTWSVHGNYRCDKRAISSYKRSSHFCGAPSLSSKHNAYSLWVPGIAQRASLSVYCRVWLDALWSCKRDMAEKFFHLWHSRQGLAPFSVWMYYRGTSFHSILRVPLIGPSFLLLQRARRGYRVRMGLCQDLVQSRFVGEILAALN